MICLHVRQELAFLFSETQRWFAMSLNVHVKVASVQIIFDRTLERGQSIKYQLTWQKDPDPQHIKGLHFHQYSWVSKHLYLSWLKYCLLKMQPTFSAELLNVYHYSRPSLNREMTSSCFHTSSVHVNHFAHI